MIELVFAVCMISEPARCRDEHMTFEGETISIQKCSLYGQQELARWAMDHPNWTISNWQCREAGLQAKL